MWLMFAFGWESENTNEYIHNLTDTSISIENFVFFLPLSFVSTQQYLVSLPLNLELYLYILFYTTISYTTLVVLY